ncbi:MAG: hypothetical protein ACI88H_003292 [Cocleimonas sp.]
MFANIFSKIKVIAKNRSVAVGGNNNAPILTGNFENSEINIDQQSFAQSEFLSQASDFDNCTNKIPLFWATHQCLKLLSPSRNVQEKIKLKFVQDKVSFTAQILNEDAKSINLLYFKNASGEIDKKDLRAIIANLPTDRNRLFTTSITTNKIASKKIKEFCDKATQGDFNTKFLNKDKDSFTGFNIALLSDIFTNTTLEEIDFSSHYFTSYICRENLEHVSELTKAFAIKLLSQLPSNEFHVINRHELEVRFGAEHYSDIFPSPPKFEASIPNNLRNQQEAILKSIFRENKNSIIHARGGVGKTVMARLANTVLPSHSCSIVYDCFGDGLYRSINNPRHSFDKVLVQIINELAINGLCDSLIAMGKNKERLIQEFKSCIESSVKCLKKGDEQAHLYIFIDAADNAVMAAKEKAENSIVTQLLNDLMIDGCTVIALCR